MMHRFNRRAVLRRAALPLQLGALLLVAGGGEIATVAAQPGPSATLQRARVAEANGEWPAAEAAYLQAMAAGGEQSMARLDLARLYERWDRYQQALDTLAPLVGGAPLPTGLERAWFQQGSALQALERDAEAVTAYRRYIDARGPATPYARIEAAKLLIGTGDKSGGLDLLVPLLGGAGPEHARRVAARVAAPVAEELGRAETLAIYRAHAALSTAAAERVPSLWKVAALERARGNRDGAVEALRTLVTRYPNVKEAEDALTSLEELGRPAGVLEAALVHYRRQNNDRARTLYNSVLASGTATERQTALFFLAALAERRDDVRAAIQNYSEAIDAQPDGRLAAEALWWRSTLLESSGDATAAQESYARLALSYADSARAAESGLRSGYAAYTGGRLAEARARWDACRLSPNGAVAATCGFWYAKATAQIGDQATARTAYTEAVRRDPTGYYGLRAAALLAGQPLAPRNATGSIAAPAEDWGAVEAWLTGWAGAEGPEWATFQASEEWLSARALLDAGWLKIATDAFTTIFRGREAQPWTLYRMGRALSGAGMPNFLMWAGQSLLAKSPAGAAPPAAQRMAYPAPWPELVQRSADTARIDPLLLYALMRQESAFNVVAGSSAGAFGLTQVVAPTGEEIARALGVREYRFVELARPALAIDFGAFYLGAQTRARDGNVYQGLAAYNAGGGSAARWSRTAGGTSDPDRFLEEIDYSETERYLHIVIENYAWYRHLYGGTDTPSIVR